MSDENPNLLSKLLQEHDLSPDKWVPLFRHEGITTTANLSAGNDDDLFESLSFKADTEDEKRGLRTLLGIHECTHTADSEIESELAKAGLEPTADWLYIFKAQLGVRTPQGLQHIGSESYVDLEQFAKKPLEKKTLRKFLGIDEEMTIKLLREKQKEKLRQRKERSQKILEELKDIQRQGIDHHDKKARQLIDGIQEALQIPEGSWIVDDSSLEALLESIKMNLDRFHGGLTTSMDLNDVEILQHSSGGRALHGVLVSRNLEDQLKIKTKLLSVPQDAQLYAPSLSRDYKIEEFSTHYQEDQFTRSMDRLGYSACRTGFLGLGGQMSVSQSKSTQEESMSECQKERYCSTIKYFFMPMASFYFKDSQLQLSADALQNLQEIEAFTGSQDALQKQCEHFFNKYGSHAKKGHLHFGGIYRVKCYSHGIQESDLPQVKNLQSQAVNALLGLSYEGFEASVKGNVSKLKANFKGDFSEALMSETTVEVTKMGGPQAASNIPLWKSGLVASNSTWSVIDCGSNTVPVWEIVQMNHKKSFQNPKRLLQILIMAWEKMTKLRSQLVGGEIAIEEEIDSADNLSVTVNRWNDENDQHKCAQYLKLLTEMKLRIAKRTMTPLAWPVLYLSKPQVQTYLKWVVKVTQDKMIKATGNEIKLLMQELVDRSDLNLVENFPDKHYISEWLYQSDQTQDILPLHCEEFFSLQKFLKQALEDLYHAQDMGQSQQQAKIHATMCVTQVVNHLRGHLHKANQRYEDIFIVTLLNPLKYDVSEKIFLRFLSSNDLEYLIKMLKEQTTEYFSAKKTSLLKTQAYLFYLTVSVFDSEASIDVSESNVKQHMLFMQNTLQNDFHPQVKDTIINNCTFYVTGYDWSAIQSDLSSVMSGFNLIQEHEGPTLKDILQATLPKQATDDITITLQSTGTIIHEDTHPRPTVTLQTLAQKESSQAFEVLLKIVDLEKYYPQKLKPKDAVCIRQETLGSLQNTEHPELLPYYIMQKIMMHNYKSRANILSSPHHTVDSDSDSDEFFDAEDLEDPSLTLRDIHPMDGLLALIHCSDNFLRQDLMAKLSTCKLAIPFLLPDPKAQTLTFPLWAMRSMVKEWKSQGQDKESRIVDCKTPIVSFLRFSASEVSKSKMLNDVIGDSEHDFFFHWDCEGGSAKRILVDGLLEVCWYLPAGKESDHFPDIISFANLHGDAREHNKQAIFVSQVSFMNFVLLTQKDIEDHNGVKLLQDLAKAPGGLVVMFCDAKEEDRVKIPKEILQRDMYNRIKLKKKNAATIKNEIRCQIIQSLHQHAQHPQKVLEQLSLIDCAGIARGIGICVDEDTEECKEGKQLATTLVMEITSLDTDSDSTARVKDMMLPLQGPNMWHKWAKHDKEKHRHINRGSRGIEQYNSHKEQDKIAVRRIQFMQANHPTPVMKLFILTLLQHKGSIREYFLQWLKLLLDDRSRDKLPELHRKYKAKRRELNKLKDQQDTDSSTLTTLKSQLQVLNEQLLHSSFGLEHLLRELGQIYESVWDIFQHKHMAATQHKEWQMVTTSEQLQSEVFRLPQVAAELMVSGYPLELMDGDASHLPLTWVNSVLDKVKEMLGDKRLFILSVLGIQSTGKSTLMNTMFGLQFTVSAGRCTRGAFIQLVPLNEQLKEDVKCDYLLIVDTEGLRAPELDSAGTQKHDNEMATFVIGLADVTIINIFGEASGDMDDILQTAVHAFLRMKNVELNPSCQFVHQNVAAISADAKGKMGKDKFHEKLDEMTRAAAEEEQCEGQYQAFKDVISFDDEKDIWYFPTLWKGDPPMAPVNPGYSERAQKLKSSLLILAKQKGSQCTIFGFQSRMKQLWRAVLDENFIFSFKNTLEITVYNELDVEYTQWSWKLQRTMLDWEQKNETVIKNAAFENLYDLEKERIAGAKILLAKVHHELKDKMKMFFEESKHSDTLAQWQDRTERRLDDLRSELEKQAEEHCRTMVRSREAHNAIDEMRDSHREELLKHVKELASKLEGKKLGEAKLKKMFEKKWTEWMQEFTARLPKVYQQDVKIDNSVERCLRKLLRKHDQQIIQELTQKPLKFWGNPLHLEIQPQKHLQSWRWGSSLGFTGITQEDTDEAQAKTENFLQRANQYLQDLKKRQIQNFSEGFIESLFNELFQDVQQFNKSKKITFKFTQQYKVDIALTVGGYALHHFEEMMKAIKKENDPTEYLKTLKVPFSKTFISQYSQSATEKTAADNLCYLLKKPIVFAVTGSLGHMIADGMMAMPTFHSKRTLKCRILLDLGENKLFEDFRLYLTDTKASLQHWVKHYTDEYCKEVVGKKSRLEERSETRLQEVIVSITEAAKNITHSLSLPGEANISDWLNELHTKLSSVLTIDKKEIKEVVGAENLKDFHFFTDEIIKGLRKMQESLLENFQSSPFAQMDNWSKQPYNILCNKMLGCCEQCPFCKEQCELTTPDHDSECKHSVKLHRPQCLGGYRWMFSGKMILEICSSSVASDVSFRNAETGNKLHPYKEYQKHYPKWSITPDSSLEASSYWKWFVANYTSQIAEHFRMKETNVPGTWKNLAWDQVKEELMKAYKM